MITAFKCHSVRLGMPVLLLPSRPTGVDGACLCRAFGFGVKKNAFPSFAAIGCVCFAAVPSTGRQKTG